MKIKSTLKLLLVFLLAANSCKKDDDNKNPEPINVPTTAISIEIPEETSLNLAEMNVVANTFSFPVEGSNESKIAFQPGQFQMAFLMDAQDNIILSGFISDANKKISVASTLEVLIYFRSGAFMLPFEFREKYISEIASVEGFNELTEELEEDFKQNPGYFSTSDYIPLLDEFLLEMIPDNDPVDIRLKRQINFDPNGVRSGIQVMDNNFQSVILRNYYRRRAHAFIYKSSFKDKDGNETIIKSSFSGADVADSQQEVKSPSALDGFLGTLGVLLAGQGARYASEDTPPINIPLGVDESEAKYKVRVIGPSPGVSWRGREHTDAEKEKWEDLMIETLFMDMVIPLMSEAFSAANDMATEEHAKVITAAVKKVADFTPFYKDLYETRDLTKFITAVIDHFISNKVNSEFQDVVADLLAENAMKKSSWEVDLNKEYRTAIKKERFLKMIKLIDLIIKGADFSKMIGEISLSSPLETFEVTAKDNDIKLSPSEASVTNFSAEELTVHTQTDLGDGQAFLYKWSTSGKYGHLRDNLGNQGIEIENGQKTISYKAETSAADLPQNAIETVTVSAYVKQGQNLTKMGEAKAIISVKPARLEIKPNDVTLNGNQKIKLYVEWANGDPFYIEDDPSFDYKFEWSTPAAYGNFEGGISTLITTVPYITYQALDTEVEEASETVNVIAYVKPKDSDNWTKYDDITGNIKIENDENLKILYVSLDVKTVPNQCDGCFTNWLNASFPREDNHESYTVRFFGFRKPAIPSVEGRTYTWKADQEVPRNIDFSRHSVVPDDRIAVWILNNAGGSGHNPNLYNKLKEFGGMIEVKIKLKPE